MDRKPESGGRGVFPNGNADNDCNVILSAPPIHQGVASEMNEEAEQRVKTRSTGKNKGKDRTNKASIPREFRTPHNNFHYPQHHQVDMNKDKKNKARIPREFKTPHNHHHAQQQQVTRNKDKNNKARIKREFRRPDNKYHHQQPGNDVEDEDDRYNNDDNSSLDSDMRPGAIAMAGHGDERNIARQYASVVSTSTFPGAGGESGGLHESNRDSYSSTTNVETPVVATLVEEDKDKSKTQNDNTPLVVATRDDNRCMDWKNRQVRIGIALVFLVVIALATGLSIMGRKNGGTVVQVVVPNTVQPTSSPAPSPAPTSSSAPTFVDWFQIGQNITAPGVFANFGSAVAISTDGRTLAMGTPANQDNSGPGSVYLFGWDDIAWTPKSAFPLTGVREGDQAGRAVALSANGNRVAIGMPYYDDDGRADIGLVQVWDYDPETRAYLQVGGNLPSSSLVSSHLGGSEATTRIAFGFGVSLSHDGNRLAIATNEGREGRVYLFEYNINERSWIFRQVFPTMAELGVPDPFYGTSVAMSGEGDHLVIADYGDEDVTRGFMRVYQEQSEGGEGGVFQQVGSTIVGAFGPNNLEYFGNSVSISDNGDVVVIAGLRGGCYGQFGQVMVFRNGNDTDNERTDDIWIFDGQMEEEAEGFRPRTVSLSGDGSRLAIQDQEGDVWVLGYDTATGIWKRIENVIFAAGEPEFRFDGEAVALSSDGRTIVVGAPELGIVRVFALMDGR